MVAEGEICNLPNTQVRGSVLHLGAGILELAT